ncbi:MAG: D-sedoheptulose-7-phosphate isomerase [Candidatus Binatia bacterium]
MKDAIHRAFEDSISAKRQFAKEHMATLVAVVELLAERLVAGSKILLFGNGGSAADAQHIAAEFVNRFMLERPPLPAIALTTDTSALTSIGNDYGFVEIFSKQVKALGREGDVALAISTSGNSSNVLRAIDACRRKKIHTVGLTGGDGGKMAGKVDHLLNVSSTRVTARVQETHILIGHVLCEMVDVKLFGRVAGKGAAASA